jgi:hypothetical protein
MEVAVVAGKRALPVLYLVFGDVLRSISNSAERLKSLREVYIAMNFTEHS